MQDVFLHIYVYNSQAVPGTFTHLKWSLVPPDFKECCTRYSWKLFKF